MAARSDVSPARWRRPFLSWLDGIEAGWAIPLLLIGFTAVWLAVLTIAYLDGDLHPDVLETWTLGRTFEWGCSKHPPLMGWVARAWTSVFPLTNWSFQLMALTNAAIGLWAVDLISRRFVTGDKRIIVLLLGGCPGHIIEHIRHRHDPENRDSGLLRGSLIATAAAENSDLFNLFGIFG